MGELPPAGEAARGEDDTEMAVDGQPVEFRLDACFRLQLLRQGGQRLHILDDVRIGEDRMIGRNAFQFGAVQGAGDFTTEGLGECVTAAASASRSASVNWKS